MKDKVQADLEQLQETQAVVETRLAALEEEKDNAFQQVKQVSGVILLQAMYIVPTIMCCIIQLYAFVLQLQTEVEQLRGGLQVAKDIPSSPVKVCMCILSLLDGWLTSWLPVHTHTHTHTHSPPTHTHTHTPTHTCRCWLLLKFILKFKPKN